MEKNVWREIINLDQPVLAELLYQYDNYVIEVTNREDGSIPVCVAEFYENEWQIYLDDLTSGKETT